MNDPSNWTDQDRQTLEETHATVQALRDIAKPPPQPIVAYTVSGDKAGLFKALAAAQANFTPLKKGSDNEYFKSKYADLAACRECSLPALNAAGFAVLWPMSSHPQGYIVGCVLAHELGTIECSMVIPAGSDIQKTGSARTYATRYLYSGLLALAADEDDDGNAAAQRTTAQAAQPRQPARQERQPVKPREQPRAEKPAPQVTEPTETVPVSQVATADATKAPEAFASDGPATPETIALLRTRFTERGMTKEQARITMKVAADCTAADFEQPGGEQKARAVIEWLEKANATGGAK